MKTAEEILKEKVPVGVYCLNAVNKQILEAMQEYSNQQIELAVDKTLIKCSAKAVLHSSQLAEEILSLRTQILNEIKYR